MEQRKKRNSILKVRQTIDVLSETVETGAGPSGPGTNRRVSFHNVKHVQQYDRDHGKMSDATPIKEKITDTLGSDGILTPRGGNMDMTNADGTFRVFSQESHGAADMSLESIGGGENQTARLFDSTKTVVYEKETIETTTTTKVIKERIMNNPNDTMAMFNQSVNEEMDMSMDRSAFAAAANDTMALFNQTNPEEHDMSIEQSMFLVPKLPPNRRNLNKTVNKTMQMDVEDGEKPTMSNDTINIFNTTNSDALDMDITATVVIPPPTTVTQNPEAKTPEPTHVDMDMTENLEKKDDEEMSALPEASETMAMFQSPARGKMTVPTPSEANETLKMFQSPARGIEQRVPVAPPSTQKTFLHDESMNISHSTVTPSDDVDMEITVEPEVGSEEMDVSALIQKENKSTVIPNETMNMFQSPSIRQSDDMDITATVIPPPTTVIQKTPESTAHVDMDMTENLEKKDGGGDDMEMSALPEASETMAMFQSPARAKTTVPTPSEANETLKMFQSPARGIEQRMPVQPPSTQKTFLHDESMNISHSTVTPSKTDDVDMEINQEDFVPQDPEDLKESEDVQNLSKVLQELEDVSDAEDVQKETTLQKTLNESSMLETSDVEEKRAVLHASMMEVSIIEESEDVENLKNPFRRPSSGANQEASTINNDSITLNASVKSRESIQMKTMRISDDPDDVTNTIHDFTEKEDEMEENTMNKNDSQKLDESTKLDLEIEETLQLATSRIHVESTVDVTRIIEDVTHQMSHSTYTTNNTSIMNCSSISKKRRRSLLDPSSMMRESPRRVALENSLYSMNMTSGIEGAAGGGGALAEYRQTKANTSELNESVASSNGGRDIFTMNTSIRSPRRQAQLNLNTARPPSPLAAPIPPSPGFQMPDFDAAVVNVVYLTSEDPTSPPLPEAVEFQKLVAQQIQNLKTDDVKIRKKLTPDEREVMMAAREEAELRFLEFRLKFAQDVRRKQDAEIQNMESRNSEIAEQLRDAQNLPRIRKELETLKSQLTVSRRREIREEYKKAKKEAFDIQMASLKAMYDVTLELNQVRNELKVEFEELNERIAQVEEAYQKKMGDVMRAVKELVPMWGQRVKCYRSIQSPSPDGNQLFSIVFADNSNRQFSSLSLLTELTTMPSQKKSNPTEVHISTDSGLIQRTLVFRNTTGKDFLLKLIPSNQAITFPTNVFRFPPTSHRVIQFRVNSSKLGQWEKNKLTIKGFVMPVYAKNLKQFIDQKTVGGTACQEAFSLAVKFTDQFSAPQTIINLPGAATCIESTDHPVDVEELDTVTALNIERDVATAAPIGSMLGFVEQYKKSQKNKGCWLSNYICGGPEAAQEKPTMRSRRSSRSSASRSGKSCRNQAAAARKKSNSGVNVCLEATPCGGSTIQA